MQETKCCTTCKQNLTLADFYVSTNRGKQKYSSYCKDCSKRKATLHKKTYVERHYRDVESKMKNLLTKARHRNKEYDDTLSVSYLVEVYTKQKGLCAYSEMPLSLEANHPHSMSLDRKDSSKGYVVGNLQLVSSAVNRMKQEFSEEFFLTMCDKIANNKTRTTQK